MNIISATVLGAVTATAMIFWDDATDYGAADAETTWFFGPVHVPTLLVSGGVVFAATMAWALSPDPKRPWVSESTVFTTLVAVPIALGAAYFEDLIVLPMYRLGKSVAKTLSGDAAAEAAKLLIDAAKP